MRICITGGAGFIGSAICRRLVRAGWQVLNIDKLTYAGCLGSLTEIDGAPNYRFERADIVDDERMLTLLRAFEPDAIVNCAAETHVDRSIDDAEEFLHTNVLGVHALLKAAHRYWRALDGERQARFRFLHVSTDEVFGALGEEGQFSERTAYEPRSPYAASKASSDHLVRAWRETYGLPAMIAISSNNYGPYQFPEKLIPLTIVSALERKHIAVYGDGRQVRDWLHVDDHVRALVCMLQSGPGWDVFVAGARSQRRNIDVVHAICDAVDALAPDGPPRRELITHVADRPGHDRRYAIDPSAIERSLGWRATVVFEDGLLDTVKWFLARRDWWEPIRVERYGGERLGLPQ